MIDYIGKFTSVTNKDQAVAQMVKYSFFHSLDLCVPTDCRCGGLLLHLITLKDTHTHAVGLPWTSDQVDTETSNVQKNGTHKRQTSMPQAGFEHAIQASKQAAADPRLRPRGHWNRHQIFRLCEEAPEVTSTYCCRG